MAKEQARRDAQLLVEARVAVFDTKKAELVAQKILAQHSTVMNVALSELVVQTAEDLRSQEVRPKDRALAMVALKTVCDRLFGWADEPDLQRMKRARASYAEGDMPEDFPPTAAVNLGLIATTPQQLAALAKAKYNQDDHSGPSPPECNDQGMGPSTITPKQPRAATHGCPIPKKDVPTGLVKEPVQPRWETDLQQAEKANRGNPPCLEIPQNALKHSLQQPSVQEPPPTPGSQAWHRLRLEELARLRAEWRGRR